MSIVMFVIVVVRIPHVTPIQNTSSSDREDKSCHLRPAITQWVYFGTQTEIRSVPQFSMRVKIKSFEVCRQFWQQTKCWLVYQSWSVFTRFLFPLDQNLGIFTRYKFWDSSKSWFLQNLWKRYRVYVGVNTDSKWSFQWKSSLFTHC